MQSLIYLLGSIYFFSDYICNSATSVHVPHTCIVSILSGANRHSIIVTYSYSFFLFIITPI